jgi:hypothetical protein
MPATQPIQSLVLSLGRYSCLDADVRNVPVDLRALPDRVARSRRRSTPRRHHRRAADGKASTQNPHGGSASARPAPETRAGRLVRLIDASRDTSRGAPGPPREALRPPSDGTGDPEGADAGPGCPGVASGVVPSRLMSPGVISPGVMSPLWRARAHRRHPRRTCRAPRARAAQRVGHCRHRPGCLSRDRSHQPGRTQADGPLPPR